MIRDALDQMRETLLARATIPLTGGLSAALAITITLLLALDQRTIGLGAAALLLCLVFFMLWPWAILPVGVVGGTIASVIIGGLDIRGIVLVHLLPLVAGCMAIVGRRMLGIVPDRSIPAPPYRIIMLVLLVLTAIGGIYGLAVGNATEPVMIAAYHVAIIPVYFLITVFSLPSPKDRSCAGILFVVCICVLAIMEFTAPGRHGGLLALLALPPLIVLTGRASGWRRAGLAGLCAVLVADVVLASFRGLWVGGGLILLIMLVRGGAVVWRGVLATLAAVSVGCTLIAAIGLGGGLLDRVGGISDALSRSPGYRAPEALVGWNVFAGRPVFGAGLGQTTRDLYIPGFAVTDVGPMYHSFYILLLANLGLVGLCAVAWPIAGAIWRGLSQADPIPIAFAAMTCGFLVSALVEGPSDGHWELGLLPALILLTITPGWIVPRRPATLARDPAHIGVPI